MNKIALLADLHSNLEALQACLRHATRQGAVQYGFLGDLVGYGADPCPVLDLVAEYAARGAVVVRGNHDAAVLDTVNRLSPDARSAIDWTRTRLSTTHRDFIDSLPLIVRRESVCYVHASADEPAQWHYVNDDRIAARSMVAADQTWCFSGHVHDQVLYYQGSGQRLMAFRPVPGVPIPVGRHRRWLALVGSTGQPRDGNTAAAYALFDPHRMQLVFHRVPYDHVSAAAKIRAAGLPESLALALENGK
jgi:diadenosine tetraphosphatase ApaH/serine/threonine PP2A family protein phosphatase